MHRQRTASRTRLVYTVNDVPVATYLRARHPEPVRRLVGDVDGHRVVWTRDRRRSSCARHGRVVGCACVHALGRLATPEALTSWRRGLSWKEARQVHTTSLAVAAADLAWRPARREWPDWLRDLLAPERILAAVLLLALLLLLAPLLRGR
jgi:hypothetical protein